MSFNGQRRSLKNSTSIGPSPKKAKIERSAVESLDGVLLDTLVLYNCLKRIHYLDRVYLESVSHQLARVLQSSYKTEEISISIDSGTMGGNCWIGVLGHKKQRHDTTRKEICVPKKKFKTAMEQLFMRFKRFKCLQLRAEQIAYQRTGVGWEEFTAQLLEALLTEHCLPSKIHWLDCFLPDCTDHDICLLDTLLSVAVKKLSLRCMTPETDDLSKKLWNAVEKCAASLRSFDFCPQHRPKNPFGFDEFANSRLRGCLKSLKLEVFRCRANASSVDETFVVETFGANIHLRRLFIANSCPTGAFSGESVLPIIGRLETLGLYFHARKLPQEDENDLVPILLALPDSSYLTVSTFVDFDFRPPIRKNVKGVAQAMRFWLKLSELTSRVVHLILNYSREMEPVTTTEKAIKSLTRAKPIVDNLVVERNREIILRRNCAEVVVKIRAT